MINQYENYQKLFDNFYIFSSIDLNKYLETFYEKVGYAFAVLKGNFLWTDEYSKEVLFETQEIEKKFQIMTDFSQYRLKKMYKEKFFDFIEINCSILSFLENEKEIKISDKYIIKIKDIK